MIQDFVFEYHFDWKNPLPADKEAVRAYNSFQWLRVVWWNYELSYFGLREVRDPERQDEWPRGTYHLLASLFFYFAMLDCLAQCIFQRYIDSPDTKAVHFGDPRKWQTEIPTNVKKTCIKITENKNWKQLRKDFRNASAHRQFPIPDYSDFDEDIFIRQCDWAFLNEDHILYRKNPNVRHMREEVIIDNNLIIKWPDDRIEAHLAFAFTRIRELIRIMFKLPYIDLIQKKKKANA